MKRFVVRLVALAALWWVLAGSPPTHAVGAATVLAAAALSLRVLPPLAAAPRPVAALRLIGHFLSRSFLGGLDVARRALLPGGRVDPVVLVVPLRLGPGPGRLLLAAIVSLLPGTVTAHLEGDRLTVHVLARDMPAQRYVQELEDRILPLYPVRL